MSMVDEMVNSMDATKRDESLSEILKEEYDLIVIGGGITGAGICLDAASRGLKTLCLEKKDFASGTSSKSTKLIHGGLRYLKQFEIGLVRETGTERAIVHKLAPHLVKSEKMLLPLTKDGTYGKLLTSFGLMVYDVLAGVEREDQRKMLSKEETLSIEPLLRTDILEGSGIYAEYRTDDARLTIEVLKSSISHGAKTLNYAEVSDFVYNDKGEISGVKFIDHLSSKSYKIQSKYVINAAGPWVDKVRGKEGEVTGKSVLPTKGVHIVVPRHRLPIHQSVYFDEPNGRMLFAIPRDRVTYIGTTDTKYHGSLDDIRADESDIQYLLEGANHIFPEANLDFSDVESTWVGVRPLIEEKGKSASEISRKDEIFESESGLLSIAGGKLTGYRKMSERIVDKVVGKLKEEGIRNVKTCFTKDIVLSGGTFINAKEVDSYTEQIKRRLTGIQQEVWANYLVSNYGMQCEHILSLVHYHKDSELALGLAELEYTIKNESVYTLLDFFERRTGRLYFYIDSIEKLKVPAVEKMAELLGWNDDLKKEQLRLLEVAMEVSKPNIPVIA